MPPPSSESVLQVLRAVPDVEQVSLVAGDHRAPIDRLLGTRRGYAEDYFVRFADLTILVQLEYREKRNVHLSYVTHEPMPPRHSLDRIAARIAAVERALAAALPGFPPHRAFHETTYDGTWP